MAAEERLVCESRELVEGGRGVRFTLAGVKSPLNGFVIRYNGVVRGFMNRCGHLPTELDSDKGRFFDLTSTYLVCSLHGAAYSPESGRCLWGPCDKKGLVPIHAEEMDGKIFVRWDAPSGALSSSDESKDLL